MTADEVSEKLCPMGFEHFGDGDTWYLRKSNFKHPRVPSEGWAGFVHRKREGGWTAMHRKDNLADQRVSFDCPVAAAVWLLTEVSNG